MSFAPSDLVRVDIDDKLGEDVAYSTNEKDSLCSGVSFDDLDLNLPGKVPSLNEAMESAYGETSGFVRKLGRGLKKFGKGAVDAPFKVATYATEKAFTAPGRLIRASGRGLKKGFVPGGKKRGVASIQPDEEAPQEPEESQEAQEAEGQEGQEGGDETSGFRGGFRGRRIHFRRRPMSSRWNWKNRQSAMLGHELSYIASRCAAGDKEACRYVDWLNKRAIRGDSSAASRVEAINKIKNKGLSGIAGIETGFLPVVAFATSKYGKNVAKFAMNNKGTMLKAADVVTRAEKGDPKAIKKIEIVKEGAKQGDPEAKKAAAAILLNKEHHDYYYDKKMGLFRIKEDK